MKEMNVVVAGLGRGGFPPPGEDSQGEMKTTQGLQGSSSLEITYTHLVPWRFPHFKGVILLSKMAVKSTSNTSSSTHKNSKMTSKESEDLE